MKTTIYSQNGEKEGSIELPKVFQTPIREDIVLKCFEASKTKQPYSPTEMAGLRHSASGTISHRRHEWKGHYGKGISRVPRKAMWRRGTQFYWIAATAPGTRGGRKAHPPKGLGADKKINRKEAEMARLSAIASTADINFIKSRYASFKEIKEAPFVIDSLPKKSKALFSTLRNIFKENSHLVLKNKTVRSGRGKSRGRKYKSNAGLLLIVGNDEHTKFKGLDIRTPQQVSVSDLYPLGRLTLFTKKAISELASKEAKNEA